MAKLVFVLFQILIPILLLNMLIAMMGNTYAIVISTADKEFLKQVSCLLLQIEESANINTFFKEKTQYMFLKQLFESNSNFKNEE